MDIEKIESKLSMKNLYFSKCTFTREETIKNGKLHIEVLKNIEPLDEHEYKVSLTLQISNDDLNLEITANACFGFNCNDMDNEKDIINANTIAIMFPFIRSQVTLMTSQPGMKPIIIPPINTARFND